jgi:hypothetical protein
MRTSISLLFIFKVDNGLKQPKNLERFLKVYIKWLEMTFMFKISINNLGHTLMIIVDKLNNIFYNGAA